MSSSLAILFPVLVLVPGLLIPLHVISRMYTVLKDEGRTTSEKIFARGTVLVMLVLMAVSVYAAAAVFESLSGLGVAQMSNRGAPIPI